MFTRVHRICRSSGEGEVVEILEGAGVRRAKVIAAGAIVEVAALGGGEIHLGDRITFTRQPIVHGAGAVAAGVALDDLLDAMDGMDDSDVLPLW